MDFRYQHHGLLGTKSIGGIYIYIYFTEVSRGMALTLNVSPLQFIHVLFRYIVYIGTFQAYSVNFSNLKFRNKPVRNFCRLDLKENHYTNLTF